MTMYINDDRYSRMRLIAWWDQERIAQSRVLVVGAGALGNEVLKNLALLGIGKIDLVDFDHIESSNLTRSVLFRERDKGKPKAQVAADAVKDLNPAVQINPICGNVITDVGLGLFHAADVVMGCLDNREARLWVNRSCWKTGTPWIDGGIQEINGVAKVFCPPDGSCYECAMTENDYRLINLRYSCPLLKQEDIQAGKVPTAPTISSIIGGLQVQEALKLIHNLPVTAGAAFVFNGQANQFYQTKYQHREDCLSHEHWPEPVLTELSVESLTSELIAIAAEHLKCEETAVQLPLIRDLVTQLKCHCGHQKEVWQAVQAVSMKDAECEKCQKTMQPTLVHHISFAEPTERSEIFREKKLYELGIAPSDIVLLQTDEAAVSLLLTEHL